jgi:hypothetical protein
MKKQLLLLTAFLFTLNLVQAQSDLVITEIMYNSPESGTDSLEFVELYNKGTTAINMNNYTFALGVTYTFGNVTINAGDYFVLAVKMRAFETVYGMPADAEWVTGSLSNGGEFIVIKDDLGNTVDSLKYNDNNPWPIGDANLSSPDGGGASIILCDYNADNMVGSNWTISTSEIGTVVNFQSIKATPGAANDACGPICSNSTSSFSVTECTSYEVPSTNNVYSAVGTYDVTDVIPNSCGEDSTMTITVTILPELTGTHNATVCIGGSMR